ncbi:MAG TPA: hypothetical protein VM076_23235 [Gemmatimonadaceae bacterium]|nr:hypothetical protein [Gemmatimonadaceae bacterium]
MSETRFPLDGGLSAPLAIGLGAVLVIEGAVLHLWVAQRSVAWAWGITALNVITLVWLWREHRATRQAGLTLTDDAIAIDAGSRLRCRIPLSAVASAEPATWRSVPDVAADFVSTAKPLEPNVVLVLREPVDVTLALGVNRRVSRIGVRVADAEALVNALSRIRS